MSKIEEMEAIQRWGNMPMQIKIMIRRHTDNEKTFLEMAHVVRGVHQVNNLSKKSVHTSGNDNNFNLALLTCRSKKDFISWLLCRWH
jgi:hypothetical protein